MFTKLLSTTTPCFRYRKWERFTLVQLGFPKCVGLVQFFFSSRRRHTRSLRDWSSDVCSSDLPSAPWATPARALFAGFADRLVRRREPGSPKGRMVGGRGVELAAGSAVRRAELFEIGRASCRERGEGPVAGGRWESKMQGERVC